VIPFEDEKDAIRIANDVRYGLFATVWTGDPARATGSRGRSGRHGSAINMPFTAFPGIPFGGYKQSGFDASFPIDTARSVPRDEGRACLDQCQNRSIRSASSALALDAGVTRARRLLVFRGSATGLLSSTVSR